MSEFENILETSSQDKSKWFTYGGKVDENLMHMLKEAQKSSGQKKFSDFMNDMLNIYRENKQDAEPPQMQVIKKAVTDIITTTESLLYAMQVIESDKFKTIADYKQRAQNSEDNALQISERISELERELSLTKKDLVTAQAEAKSLKAELNSEMDRKKGIEGMISRIQQHADEAFGLKEKAETDLKVSLKVVADAKNKAALLEAANQELQSKVESNLLAINRAQEELASERQNYQLTSEKLTIETIARNRLEERMQILEPQLVAATEKIELLQQEVNRLRLSEQSEIQKSSLLEIELQKLKK
ncbi:hypothetical protein [Dendrosporobacter sp. 1207_IL3150]|uniref:hypothetical protein n=1 Tax=Dendrosporobacter sp. 1207_IL3150 TaxID=3084054 RepID=UPI002FDA0561